MMRHQEMTQSRMRRRKENGFTLIELMATLAILAVIVLIAVPAVGGILSKAEASADAASIEMIENAGALAHVGGLSFDDSGGEKYTVETLIDNGYLSLDEASDLMDPESYVQQQANGTFKFYAAVPPNDASDFDVTLVNDNAVKILNYMGSGTDVRIPRAIDGQNVTTLGGNTAQTGTLGFANKGLTSVAIPDSVETIEKYSFYGNNLTDLTLPNSVTTIGMMAFSGNELTTVSLSDSLASIGDYAFHNNKLTAVSFPDSVVSIGKYAFGYNKLTSVSLPDSVTIVGDSAFSNNDLTSVMLSNSLTSIESVAFAYNEIETLTIPESVTSIGQNAFYTNNLTTVTIPASVETIARSAFYDNPLETVTILNPDATIGPNAFAPMGSFLGNRVIRGYTGSTAEAYAETDVHYIFEPLD